MGSKRPYDSAPSDRATKKQQKQQPRQQKDQNGASTNEDAKLLCPIACGPGTGDHCSLDHPCGNATKALRDIAKLNEHLKRVHSGQYTCRVCKTPFSIVSKASLEVLQQAHERECNPDKAHPPGRRLGKATGPARMTPEQHGRWAKWRDQKVPIIDGEPTIKTSWRKIWICLWPDDQPPEIISEHDTVPQPAAAIPKEEENISLDTDALAQPTDNPPQLDRPHGHRDSIPVDYWGHPNTPNPSLPSFQFPPEFPAQGGGDAMAHSDDGRSSVAGYFVQPHAGQQHLLPTQHNNAFATYSPYPPSMVYSDGTYYSSALLDDQQTTYDRQPPYLYSSSQASGGAGFGDAGIGAESTELEAALSTDESLKDQDTSLLGIQGGGWTPE